VTEVYEKARIKPTVLQVESHPYFSQKPLIEHCRKMNIACKLIVCLYNFTEFIFKYWKYYLIEFHSLLQTSYLLCSFRLTTQSLEITRRPFNISRRNFDRHW